MNISFTEEKTTSVNIQLKSSLFASGVFYVVILFCYLGFSGGFFVWVFFLILSRGVALNFHVENVGSWSSWGKPSSKDYHFENLERELFYFYIFPKFIYIFSCLLKISFAGFYAHPMSLLCYTSQSLILLLKVEEIFDAISIWKHKVY